ncbi:MAG: hypothetical protein NTV43_04075 [Methylococcales bacterium]|nr:hypothetical protein [Methylococcales bacterium]
MYPCILKFRVFLMVLLLVASGYAYGDFEELSGIASGLGFKPEDEEKLLSGEVITANLPETTDKMLAQSFAIYVPMYSYKIADLVLSARVFEGDATVLASGRIDPVNIAASLAKASFTAKEADELKRLKDFRGGDDFNLSSEEIAKLTAAIKTGKSSAKDLSKVYREILAGRMLAYLKSGIQGMAAYDRGEAGKSSVTADLEAMTKASTMLSEGAPGLYRSFLDYPKKQSAHITDGFFWVKRKVQGRPTFVLEHRMLENSPEGGLIVMRREFFVGHTYNAAQAVSGAYTIAQKGTLVFSTLRSSSDRVAGPMSASRHAQGRKMMADELVARLKSLRKHFAK